MTLSQLKTKFLSFSFAYDFIQQFLGAEHCDKFMISEYIKPQRGHSILDIGCGTGKIIEYLPPDINYTGFDSNKNYINQAKNKYGSKARFYCADLNREHIKNETYDIILALKILHHLSDKEADNLFGLAFSLLKPNGRFISIDNCHLEKQSPLARFFIDLDRGSHIRTPDEYLNLARKHFSISRNATYSKLLRIPYNHFIMECKRK